MYKRAEELYETWARKAFPDIVIGWDDLDAEAMRGWYAVAASEASRIQQVHLSYQDAINDLKTVINTMVKRKHYNDAIKSLSVCQNQIETMMLELRRLDSKNAIAGDADIVLGMLEAIITANPDMQTDEWKADQKIKQDQREEKRRAAVQAKMWEGTVTADEMYGNGWEMAGEAIGAFKQRMKWNKENVKGAVGKDYKP